jgi:hypothetical protein
VALMNKETTAREEKADTEIVVANVAEVVIVAMVAVTDFNTQPLKSQLFLKAKILLCFLIISVLDQFICKD